MKEYSFQATTIFDKFATNFRIVKAILLIIMGCNVVVTDEDWVNGVGFIDIRPVKTIEAWLLKAGCLPHPTNVSIETGKFLWKKNHERDILSPYHTGSVYKKNVKILLVLTRIYCSCQGKQNICMSKDGDTPPYPSMRAARLLP